MKTYVLLIAGVVILASIIELISPSKKCKKVISIVTKLAIILSLLAPIQTIFDKISSTDLTQTYIQGIDDEYINNSYQTAIDRLLSETGVKASISIDREKKVITIECSTKEEGEQLASLLSPLFSSMQIIVNCQGDV